MSQHSFIQATALVTGGCGGLGRAIAESFLRAGSNVVVCDINADLIADFKEKVSAAYPECTLVLQADITKDENIEMIFSEGEKLFGGLDFVVNCAGRIDRFDAVAEMERQMWDKVIALNLTAPAIVSGRAIKKWLEGGKKGSIVNIASIAGFRGFTCGSVTYDLALVNLQDDTDSLHRRGIHSKQARLGRPDEEHCRFLWSQRYPLQCRCRWCHGHEHRQYSAYRRCQHGGHDAHATKM